MDNQELKQLYEKLILILLKNKNKYNIIDSYFEYIELSSYQNFINSYNESPIFCNSIYRYILNISRGLNICINKIFFVRKDSECIKGSNYYTDLILEFLNNEDKESVQSI
jgi:hypothetical protein